MQTDKDKKHVSSQVMELKDLISGPLVATIDADTISSRRYLVRKSLTANMKVKVRMQQADMPGGLSNLLHLTTSNVQSESVDETEGKEVNDGQ